MSIYNEVGLDQFWTEFCWFQVRFGLKSCSLGFVVTGQNYGKFAAVRKFQARLKLVEFYRLRFSCSDGDRNQVW